METKRIKNKLRRIALFTLLFFVFEVVPVPLWIPWAPAEIYSHIAGKVTDAQTGEPVANLDVIAVKSGDSTGQTYSAKTTSKGNYDICCAPPGTYQLLIDPQSPYIRQFPHKEVTVIRGRNVINANFTVQKGNSVSGTIFDSNSTTPVNLGVAIATQIPVENEDEVDLTYFISIGDGQFSLSGLKPGKKYRIYANITNRASVYKDLQTPSTGQELKNVSFTLGHPSTKISGTIEANGAKIKDAEVRVMSDKVSGYATTDEQGRFVISGLVAGKYIMTVIAKSYEPFGQLGIEVQSQQETVKHISLTPSATTSSKTQPYRDKKRMESNNSTLFGISSAHAATPAFAQLEGVWIQFRLRERDLVLIQRGTLLAASIAILTAATLLRAALLNSGILVDVPAFDVAQTICKAQSDTKVSESEWEGLKADKANAFNSCSMMFLSCANLLCPAVYGPREITNLKICQDDCGRDLKLCIDNAGQWKFVFSARHFF